MRAVLFVVLLVGGLAGLHALFGWDLVWDHKIFLNHSAGALDEQGFLVRVNSGFYGLYRVAEGSVDSPILAWAGLAMYFSMLGAILDG